jgi:hypothetical protein
MDYAAKQAVENGVVYFNKVTVPVNLTFWSCDKTVYCRYGEGEDCVLKHVFPLTVNLTPPAGIGEFILTVFRDGDLLVIQFLEV